MTSILQPPPLGKEPGLFIVLEGLDGAGTTTQLQLLKEGLLAKGHGPVNTSAEPTGGPFGAICRQALQGFISLDPVALTYAFSADRADHVFGHDGIMEHLRLGAVEVCDRYLYSTVAYQSVRVPQALTWDLNHSFPRPDLLVFLDVPVEHCLERLDQRESLPEVFENQSYLEQVDANYRAIFAGYAGQDWFLTVDGTRAVPEVAAQILAAVETALGQARSLAGRAYVV